MKIPDAYFAGGLGQRLPAVAPAPIINIKGSPMADAVAKMADTVGGIAEKRMAAENKQEFEKRKSEAEAARVAYAGGLDDLLRELRSDQNLPADQHLKAYQERAGALRRETMSRISPDLYDAYSPHFDAMMNHGKGAALDHLDKKRLADEKARKEAEASALLISHDAAMSGAMHDLRSNPDIPVDRLLDAYREKTTALNEEYLAKVPDELKAGFKNAFDERVTRGLAGVYKDIEGKTREHARASIAAIVGDLQASTRPRTEKLAILSELPESVWRAAGMGADDRAKTIRSFAEKTAEAEIDATLNVIMQKGTTGIKDLERFAGQLSASDGDAPRMYPELDPQKRQRYISGITSQVGHLQNELQQEANRQRTEARQYAQELVTEFKDKVSRGWLPNSADDMKFVQTVKQASSLSPSLARQYNEAAGNMSSFAYREKLRKNDPLGVAAAEKGVVIPPLNILDPASLPQQVAARMQLAGALNVKAVLLGPEVEAFTEHLKTLNPREQVQYVSTTAKAFGQLAPATLNAAAEQTRQAAPQVSMLFKLVANGKMNEARQYADGLAVINDEKKGYLKDKITRINADIVSGLDTSMGTALMTMPGTRDALRNAVAVAYVGAANQRGLSLDSVDPDLLRQVTEGVIGRTVGTGRKWLGQEGSWKTTIVPAGMSPDQFTNAIRDISPKAITDRGGVAGMSDAEASGWLKRAAWHETAGGYMFYKDHKPLCRKDGKLFVFSFER